MRKLYYLPLLIVWASSSLQVSAQAVVQNTVIPRGGSNNRKHAEKKVMLQKLELTLKQLERTYNVSFFYNSKLVSGKLVQPLNKYATIEEALNELLPKTGLSYKKVKDGFYALSSIIDKKASINQGGASSVDAEISPAAQLDIQESDITVRGKVTDIKGDALPGVSVSVKGTTKGAMTEVDGTYTLSAPRNATLVLTYIGYMKSEVAINGKTSIDVKLTSDNTSLNEVVLVGYTTVEKQDLTGSISTIKAEDLQITGVQSFDRLLAGRAAGVMVMQNSGAPGAGASINIRGAQSLTGDNEPLYVIDGVPILKVQQFDQGSAASFTPRENPLLSINPNDIESIDILKDASAAGIYGARAANGVIIVKTKRGKYGQKPTVNFNYAYSIQKIANTYDMLSADEFRDYLTQIKGLQKPGTGNTNWMEELLNNNAGISEANVSLRGGTEQASYSASISSGDQKGLVDKSSFKRYSIRLSVDTKVTEKVSFGATMNYSHSRNWNGGVERIGDVISFRPDFPVYDENGNFYMGNTPGTFLNNPVKLNTRDNSNVSRNLLANGYLEVKLMEGLRYRSSVNVGEMSSEQNSFTPKSLRLPNGLAQLFQSEYVSNSATFDNTLNYIGKINDIHSINALVGVSWFRSSDEATSRGYEDFPDDKVLTNPGSANRALPVSSGKVPGVLNSYFGRVDYGFRDRYLLTLTGRYDGSSKFGPAHQWGFFPSVAVGWKVHNEAFMSGLPMVNNLKLRASLGKTGNANIQSFLYETFFAAGYRYNGQNGFAVTGLPNPNIKWETTDQLDAALEFGVFNDRLYGELGYFSKKTHGLLTYAPIEGQLGAGEQIQNRADIQNTGFEMLLGGDIIRTPNVRWTTSFNYSRVKNRVNSLNGGFPYSGGGTGNIREGEPLGFIMGHVVDHIFQSAEEIDALNAQAKAKGAAAYQSASTAPGDYMFKDLNGDGTITSADRTIIGYIQPDYFGGWYNAVEYKGLELSFLFTYAAGNSKEWLTGETMHTGSSNVVRDLVYDAWTPENPGATYSRVILDDPNNNRRTSTANVKKADYLKLKNVQLAYTVPQALSRRLFLERAQVFVAATNIFSITNYPGLDAEAVTSERPVSNSTVDRGRDLEGYPFSRVFSVGVNVGF